MPGFLKAGKNCLVIAAPRKSVGEQRHFRLAPMNVSCNGFPIVTPEFKNFYFPLLIACNNLLQVKSNFSKWSAPHSGLKPVPWQGNPVSPGQGRGRPFVGAPQYILY